MIFRTLTRFARGAAALPVWAAGMLIMLLGCGLVLAAGWLINDQKETQE